MFLRKQLGLYIERKTKPRRATDCVRFNLGRLSRFFDWRNALTIVKPDTLIRWHRKGFPSLLEMEISASWTTVDPGGPAAERVSCDSQQLPDRGDFNSWWPASRIRVAGDGLRDLISGSNLFFADDRAHDHVAAGIVAKNTLDRPR